MTKSEKATIADVVGMLNAISNKQEEQSEDQPSNQDPSKLGRVVTLEDVEFIKKLTEDTKDCVGVNFEVPCVLNDGTLSVCCGQFGANTWHALLTAFLEKYE